MNEFEEYVAKLGKTLQMRSKGTRKLKLIGYTRALERKAMLNPKFERLARTARNLSKLL